jgi:hypothetical protein
MEKSSWVLSFFLLLLFSFIASRFAPLFTDETSYAWFYWMSVFGMVILTAIIVHWYEKKSFK